MRMAHTHTPKFSDGGDLEIVLGRCGDMNEDGGSSSSKCVGVHDFVIDCIASKFQSVGNSALEMKAAEFTAMQDGAIGHPANEGRAADFRTAYSVSNEASLIASQHQYAGCSAHRLETADLQQCLA